MTKRRSSDQQVTYLFLMDDNSERKVTVPADWNVTFGALIPGSQSNAGRIALRIWKGKQQKAVFEGVKGFRDMSIPIEEKITKTQAETYYKGEGDNRKAVNVEVAASEWVNPDKPREQSAPVQRLIPDGMTDLNLEAYHGAKRAR